ncbi:MAG: hypothetical protein AABW84_00835 [Nanoarchaeota archaeon]
MKKKIIIAAIIIIAVALVLLALFVLPQFITNSAALSDSEISAIYAQVAPEEVTLSGTWQNIGPKLIESGAVDLDEFKSLYESYGNPLTDEQIKFFTEGSNEPIIITQKNSHFILNTLWALGLVNKNQIYEKEPMSKYIENGQAANLASTGGWSLGTKDGGELLNSAEIIKLTPEQQEIAEKVAFNSYRPCCNNPTAFPDCNHGSAALGLIELLASQGFSADEIAEAVKDANSISFSQNYYETAVYFKAVEGKDWSEVDPWEVIGKDYSSASGAANTKKKLQELNLVPKAQSGGGGCGV